MVTTYSLDGLRVDTAPEVARPFWREFSGAAGVFTLGEVAFTGGVGLLEARGLETHACHA
jgi:hypothetical protein